VEEVRLGEIELLIWKFYKKLFFLENFNWLIVWVKTDMFFCDGIIDQNFRGSNCRHVVDNYFFCFGNCGQNRFSDRLEFSLNSFRSPAEIFGNGRSFRVCYAFAT